MNEEDRQLVTIEPVKFEKQLVEVQDCKEKYQSIIEDSIEYTPI